MQMQACEPQPGAVPVQRGSPLVQPRAAAPARREPARRLTRRKPCSPNPAERLLRHLAAHSVPICLATSSHLRHYTLKTTNHGDLFSLFNHRVTGEAWAHRPAPARGVGRL